MNNLTFAHPNLKNTGSAVKFELHPAEDGREGHIAMWIAPQKENTDTKFYASFDWDKAIFIRLPILDIAGMLEVFRGYRESLADNKGFFHVYANRNVNIRMEHRLEPCPLYYFSISQKMGDERRQITFGFTMCEALVLSEVFTSSLVRMAFG